MGLVILQLLCFSCFVILMNILIHNLFLYSKTKSEALESKSLSVLYYLIFYLISSFFSCHYMIVKEFKYRVMLENCLIFGYSWLHFTQVVSCLRVMFLNLTYRAIQL